MKTTAEEIDKYISHFHDIWVDGKKVDPPYDKKLTIYCKSTYNEDEEGFAINKLFYDLGLYMFIARKWILHEELEKLMGHTVEYSK